MGKATFGSIFFPSRLWTPAWDTFSTDSGWAKVTKPKPLECLVAGSLITMASTTGPNWEKYSFMESSVVCQERPPTNILLEQEVTSQSELKYFQNIATLALL